MRRKRLVRAVVIAVVMTVGVAVPSAEAARLPVNGVMCNPAYIWSGPGGTNYHNPGNYIVGALAPGQTFDYQSGSYGGWHYGFAYGQVNRYGWIWGLCLI